MLDEVGFWAGKIDLLGRCTLGLQPKLPVRTVHLPMRLVRRDFNFSVFSRNNPPDSYIINSFIQISPSVGNGCHGTALELALDKNMVWNVFLGYVLLNPILSRNLNFRNLSFKRGLKALKTAQNVCE
jgi:hypothetical protein